MRAKIILAATTLAGSLSAMAQGAAELAIDLVNTAKYASDATFEVLLPQANEPVTYNIWLESESTPADTLSPCSYLIRWEAMTSSKPMSGFSSYFDGDHYRYRNNRLQEYHAASNLQSFQPAGPESRLTNGVQSTAQFADMLPQFIGKKIQSIISDPSYVYAFHPDTVVGGSRRIVLDGAKRGNGYDVMTFSYVFDKDTKLPVTTEIENSPGSISEQLVSIKYTQATAPYVEISEEGLMNEWPEVFEKYRESTFRTESLVGTMLPEFSCQMLDAAERYSHNLNEPLNSKTIMVFLDPKVSTTPEFISDIREAAEMIPTSLDIIWAFNSNHEEEIKGILGQMQRNEKAFISANSLIRSCGITMYPTTLIIDESSKINDVVSGFNKDTALIVVQKTMID